MMKSIMWIMFLMILALLFGGMVCYLFYVRRSEAQRRSRCTVPVQAEVADYDVKMDTDGDLWCPIVRYSYGGSEYRVELREVQGGSGGIPKDFPVGSSAQIYIDPKKPENVSLIGAVPRAGKKNASFAVRMIAPAIIVLLVILANLFRNGG